MGVDNRGNPDIPEDELTPVSIRAIVVVREFAAPLLFWAPGARLSLNWQGHPPWWLMTKFFCFSMIGVMINLVLWILSPMDPECEPESRCPGKGILFDFTIFPHMGLVAPVFSLMWYPFSLIFITVLNQPLFEFIYEACSYWFLVGQWLATSGVIALGLLFAHMAGAPAQASWTVPLLIFYEAVFLTSAALSAPWAHTRIVPWLPSRVLQYMAAVSLWLMIAGVPLNGEMSAIAPVFLVYGFIVANKFLALGFVMATESESAVPVMSRYWPVMVFVLAAGAPSTNFYLAGSFVYPYFPYMVDRCLYVGGALVLLFFIDRIGRFCDSMRMPRFLWISVWVNFLFHSLFTTLCLAYGIYSVNTIMIVCVVSSVVIAVPFDMATAHVVTLTMDVNSDNTE